MKFIKQLLLLTITIISLSNYCFAEKSMFFGKDDKTYYYDTTVEHDTKTIEFDNLSYENVAIYNKIYECTIDDYYACIDDITEVDGKGMFSEDPFYIFLEVTNKNRFEVGNHYFLANDKKFEEEDAARQEAKDAGLDTYTQYTTVSFSKLTSNNELGYKFLLYFSEVRSSVSAGWVSYKIPFELTVFSDSGVPFNYAGTFENDNNPDIEEMIFESDITFETNGEIGRISWDWEKDCIIIKDSENSIITDGCTDE